MEYVYLNREVVLNSIRNLSQITFEVTDACNLHCKYCGYGEMYGGYDKRENKRLPVGVAYRILEYWYEQWRHSDSVSKKTYISFYGGEPLLNMDFIQAVVEWVEAHPLPQCDFEFTMTTNAVLLHRYIDYLVEHRFRILVSLDGNKTNNGYRLDFDGHSSFERVFENVKSVQRNYPEYFDKYISFNSVLHNLNDYETIVDFFQKEFGKLPSIAELSNRGVKEEKRGEYLRMRNGKLASYGKIKDKKRFEDSILLDLPESSLLGTYLFAHSGNVFYSYRELLANPDKRKWYPTGTCLPFSRRIFVTVNGKILLCERVDQYYALGHVDENGIEIDVDKIVDMYNGYFSKYIPQCSKCYHNNTCKQCILQHDDLQGKAVCPRFMNKEAFDIYQAEQLSFLAKHPTLYRKIMTDVIVH